MPGENLTRIEAEERAALLHVQEYAVLVDLTGGPTTFRTRTTVRFAATQPHTDTFIDAITTEVHTVTLNGVALDPAQVADGTRITLSDLAIDNVLVVDAEYAYTNTGEGLHRFVDPADGEVYLYTQFEVPDARRMYAVFEQPDLKATFQFTVIAPSAWRIVSNMPTPEPIPVSDSISDSESEASTWSFAPTPRISSYLTALIAGPYYEVRSELTSTDGRTIPLGVFCRQSLAEYLDPEAILDITRRGFTYYEHKFQVPYPFAKYDQLFVPEFNAGAMENVGAVTFTETYVFRSKVTDAVRERRVVTILHELAHMWFGDLVTMRWWNDLWLNESFAEWASTIATAEATEWHHAWTTFNSMEKAWAYRQDQLPSTHPIAAHIRDLDDVRVNFDGITYAKGGSVLKQLAAWVGVDAFFAGVGNYFREHAWGNTTLADLLRHLAAASGRDLSGWSAEWLETAGVNTLRPELTVAADGTLTSVAVLQSAPAEHPMLRSHRIAIGCYDTQEGAMVRTHRVEFDLVGERTEVPELVGRPRPALLLLNDDDLAYAKIRLDADSNATAIASLCHIADPLARALVWSATWDATRDAEYRASDYLTLARANLASETESTTLRIVLANAQLAASSYVAPERRTAARHDLADMLWKLAHQAAPGSDAQFQFVKAFAGLAEASSYTAELAALFHGKTRMDGLDIDTDLGWELLIGLVAAGGAGEPEIAARVADDHTLTGQQSAAHARAVIPTPADKARAWASIVEDTSAPNLIVRATTLGFSRADPALLAPFVDRYFAALTGIWRDRSFAIADTLVAGLYPAPLVHPTLVAAATAWLDANPETPPLRRLVIEALAGTERALRAQTCDAG